MTIDEAIKHVEEVAEENYGRATAYFSDREVYKHEEKKCLKCADEHMQLAEWLKDYKRLLEQEPMLGKIRVEIENDWQLKKYPSSPFSCGLRRAIEIIDKYKTASEEVTAK